MKNIIIFGSAGHAGEVIDIIQETKQYLIVGLLDDYKEKGTEILGYKILGKIEDISHLKKSHKIDCGVIGIGDNFGRHSVYLKIKDIIPEFNFETVIHPQTSISKNVKIGEGTVIMPGTIININCKIGNFCILNTKSSLDHDGIVGDFSSLAPGVTTGGNVSIGEFSAISLGANIIHNVKIGIHCVIGAGALVLKDIKDFSVAYGVPAKEIKKRKIGESYLK